MRIGIIGAMEVEVATLIGDLAHDEVTRHAGMEFHAGAIDGADVVVVRSGVGKVSAALCAQVLVDLFGVGAVVNTGVAGSLDARIDVGDVVGVAARRGDQLAHGVLVRLRDVVPRGGDPQRRVAILDDREVDGRGRRARRVREVRGRAGARHGEVGVPVEVVMQHICRVHDRLPAVLCVANVRYCSRFPAAVTAWRGGDG